jgi:hypothetical protein
MAFMLARAVGGLVREVTGHGRDQNGSRSSDDHWYTNYEDRTDYYGGRNSDAIDRRYQPQMAHGPSCSCANCAGTGAGMAAAGSDMSRHEWKDYRKAERRAYKHSDRGLNLGGGRGRGMRGPARRGDGCGYGYGFEDEYRPRARSPQPQPQQQQYRRTNMNMNTGRRVGDMAVSGPVPRRISDGRDGPWPAEGSRSVEAPQGFRAERTSSLGGDKTSSECDDGYNGLPSYEQATRPPT